MKNIFKYILIICGLSSVSIAQENEAPKAAKHPSTLIIHNDTLIDNYFYLRDKNSSEVLNYLYAENAFTEYKMKESIFLQKIILEELKSRIKENTNSKPIKNKNYYYFTRTEKGKEYPIQIRKKDSINSPIEEVVLDINKLAAENPYINVSGYALSYNQQFLYYGVDTKGNRVLTYYLKNINKDSVYQNEKLESVMSLIWSKCGKYVYYTKPEDKTLRQHEVYKHTLGTPVADDQLIYKENDKTFEISISNSVSHDYIFLDVGKSTSNEIWIIKDDTLKNIKPILFQARSKDKSYRLQHYEKDEFYVFHNFESINFQLDLYRLRNNKTEKIETTYKGLENELLTSYALTKDYLIVQSQDSAQSRIKIVDRKNKTEEIYNPGIPFGSISYSFEDFDYFKTDEIFINAGNYITPNFQTRYNLLTKEKKREFEDTLAVPYNANDYVTERVFVKSHDGKSIPLTLAYKKGISKNGQNPVYLTGYGSYGAPSFPNFSSTQISYLQRGFILAIAHIRGGNENGNQWYNDGKMFNKQNTFSDFISCAEYLIIENYTNNKKLAINGGSAGGLLMGAVLNQRPDLFQCAIADVPFVDVINTMLDESLPLTTFEFEEWGNPKIREQYECIKKYSPYDNVKKQNYPHLLINTGFNDSQVGYWEPTKWAAKLRELKTDSNLLLFKINMNAGHAGSSGRNNILKDIAFNMAFIMKCLGIKENYLTLKGKIYDEKNNEIPFANVYIEGTTNGTTSNADGEFSLTLKEGDQKTIVVQSLGYIKKKIKLDLNTITSEMKIVLKSENYLLNEVTIKANARDPAYAIMKEAVKRRQDNFELVKSFSADIYMKTNVRLLKVPKKLPFFLAANKSRIPDTNNLGIIYLSESVAKYFFEAPDKVKEKMIASKVAGTKTGFSWNRVEDVFVNFYKPSINMSFYSERPFISPLANGSVLSYKFKLLGTTYIDNKPVHRIQVSPRRKGDPLFNGEIYIAEGDNYQIYSTDLYVTKDAQIDFADTVHMKQEMVKVNDSIWMPLQLQLSSHIKVFGFTATDHAAASISNYVVNKSFGKKFFGYETFRIEEEANKKDTSFWSVTRPSILSNDENKYYVKGDSVIQRMESDEYKDSVVKAENKFNIGDLLLNGYTYRNRFKNSTLSIDPLVSSIGYNTVEGTTFNFNWSYYRRNREEHKHFFFRNWIHYGLDNQRWSGGIRISRRFNSLKWQTLVIDAGRNIAQFNSHQPIGSFMNAAYTLLYKKNYMKLFQNDLFKVSYSQEIANGLYGTVSASVNRKEALRNSSFYYFIEQPWHFTSNNPLNTGIYNDSLLFKPFMAAYFQLGLKWFPFSRYESYPDFKRILPSKYPEILMNYKKGIGFDGAKFNYDLIELGVGKTIELRAVGEFKFDVLGGIFFNSSNMNFTDYKHFNGNQTLFLTYPNNNDAPGLTARDPITEFHNLDYYSYSTNKMYLEAHASHNFRGFFISKVPFLRRTKFYELVGINSLILNDKIYTEVYAGLDKIIKVFRFDVGTTIQTKGPSMVFVRFGFRFSLF